MKDEISPYLLLPLRTEEQATQEIMAFRQRCRDRAMQSINAQQLRIVSGLYG